MSAGLHDVDFYAWTRQQLGFLRSGDLSRVDIANLIEEVESMGERDKREVRSRLVVLLVHLLKWRYQPARRGNSWRRTVNAQRTELELLFDDSPSLRRVLEEGFPRCYQLARGRAADETGVPLAVFPEECPWPCSDVLSSGFWPAAEEGGA